jgi:hypothetical protein
MKQKHDEDDDADTDAIIAEMTKALAKRVLNSFLRKRKPSGTHQVYGLRSSHRSGEGKDKTLKLMISMIPRTTWGANLRKKLSRSQWEKLRVPVLAKYRGVCRICGSSDRLSCDEVWEYDKRKRVQKLVELQALCGMCHHVKHFGQARRLAAEGHLDLDAVVEHFMRVNGVDEDIFSAHKSEAFQIWRERSLHEWRVDYGEWASLANG